MPFSAGWRFSPFTHKELQLKDKKWLMEIRALFISIFNNKRGERVTLGELSVPFKYQPPHHIPVEPRALEHARPAGSAAGLLLQPLPATVRPSHSPVHVMVHSFSFVCTCSFYLVSYLKSFCLLPFAPKVVYPSFSGDLTEGEVSA